MKRLRRPTFRSEDFAKRRAAEYAQRAGEQETVAGYYAVSALREALFGDANRARQQAMIAVRHPGGRDTAYGVALAFAYAGDANRAQQFADDLARRLNRFALKGRSTVCQAGAGTVKAA
jgi:hypothetical protein